MLYPLDELSHRGAELPKFLPFFPIKSCELDDVFRRTHFANQRILCRSTRTVPGAFSVPSICMGGVLPGTPSIGRSIRLITLKRRFVQICFELALSPFICLLTIRFNHCYPLIIRANPTLHDALDSLSWKCEPFQSNLRNYLYHLTCAMICPVICTNPDI